MDKNLVFGIKEGEEVTYLTLRKKRINVPPFGVLTADEVVKRKDVLSHLVANRNVFPVLRELTPEELAEYEAGLELESEEIPVDEDAEESDEESSDELSLEAAQAEYEELTGKKAGNMKLETLLKKIEAEKTKTE